MKNAATQPAQKSLKPNMIQMDLKASGNGESIQ